MAAELFTLDRSKLGLIAAGDPMGFLGQLSTAPQACRAAFLAANVGAVAWDKAVWPDLTMGVWSDPPAARPDSGRRRRPEDESDTAELSTWLQLRPTWPQLGGPSIQWLLAGNADRTDYDQRVEDLADAVVVALNTTYRRSMQMARTLVGADEPALADGTSTKPAHTPTLTAPPAQLTGPAIVATPEPEPEPTLVTTLPTAQTYTASRVAHSELEVGEVLATLTRGAESASAREAGTLVHVSHAVTPLPSGIDGLSSNGQRGRFLVTLTATITPRI